MVTWSFDARDANAARQARRSFVAYVERSLGPSADTSAAELVLGELIGNVARYAPGPAYIEAELDGSIVTITVSDAGPGFYAAAGALPADPLAVRGRGLHIVRSLASELQVRCMDDAGCRVSASIPLQPVT